MNVMTRMQKTNDENLESQLPGNQRDNIGRQTTNQANIQLS